jgi:hypothetical protein
MQYRTTIAISLAAALGFGGCATKTQAPPPPEILTGSSSTAKGGSRQQAVVVTATVEKVDLEKRQVTLRGPEGDVSTIHVGDEVRNLPQVKRGDHVIVTYYESVAFQVLKPGEAKPSISAADEAGRARLGDKPGAAAAKTVTLVATIMKLDRKAQKAVLRGPEGKTITVDVQNPENFDKVKVGDTVEIVLTEALAIDVQEAPKR